MTQQKNSGVRLTVDHIIPESLGGATAQENLCLACWDCNLIKGRRISAIDPITQEEVALFNPLTQAWGDHFQWSEDANRIMGLTPVGRATVRALKLNRPFLVEVRRRWAIVGWHPPEE
ncbi:MAG: HNH endonuclease signature motif containing protein [Chloroflexota bacterium]